MSPLYKCPECGKKVETYVRVTEVKCGCRSGSTRQSQVKMKEVRP